jgi:hypothetical protein
MSEHQYAVKMRQSLAQFEQAFHYEAAKDERRRQHVQRAVAARSRRRFHEREKAKSSVRFYLLMLSLVVTAVTVTVVMLATLYLLLV